MTAEHALLIGGTRGLGRIAALRFARQGARVSVVARRPPDPPFDAALAIRAWATDVTLEEETRASLREIVALHGRPARLIFSQRQREQAPSWSGEIEASLNATRRIIDALVEDHDLSDCAIVLVSSINAHLVSGHLPLAYHVAKAGLVQMARHYAVALGHRRIRINSVSPGTFLKPESQQVILDDPSRRKFHESVTPLGRIGTAEEIAQVIDFLSGPQSSFVTGQDLIADGGTSLRFQETVDARPPVP